MRNIFKSLPVLRHSRDISNTLYKELSNRRYLLYNYKDKNPIFPYDEARRQISDISVHEITKKENKKISDDNCANKAGAIVQGKLETRVLQLIGDFKSREKLYSKREILLLLSNLHQILMEQHKIAQIEDIVLIFKELDKLRNYLNHQRIREWSGPFWDQVSADLKEMVENANLKELSIILKYYSYLSIITPITIEFLRTLINKIDVRLAEREYIPLQYEELDALINISVSLAKLKFDSALRACREDEILAEKRNGRVRYRKRKRIKNPAFYYMGKRKISLEKVQSIDMELMEGGTAGLSEMFVLGPMGGFPERPPPVFYDETYIDGNNQIFINRNLYKQSMEAFEKEKRELAVKLIRRAVTALKIWTVDNMIRVLEVLPDLNYSDRHLNLGASILTRLLEKGEINPKKCCKLISNLGDINCRLGDSKLLQKFLDDNFNKGFFGLDTSDISHLISGLGRLNAKNIDNFLKGLISEAEMKLEDFTKKDIAYIINGLGRLGIRQGHNEFTDSFRALEEVSGFSLLCLHPGKKTLDKISAKVRDILLNEENFDFPEFNFTGAQIALLTFSLAQIGAEVPKLFELVKDEMARGSLIKADPFEMSLCLSAFVITDQIDIETFESILERIEKLTPDDGYGDGYDIIRHRVAQALIHFRVKDNNDNKSRVRVTPESFLEHCFINYALYQSNIDRVPVIIREAANLLDSLGHNCTLRQPVSDGLFYVDVVHKSPDTSYVLEVATPVCDRGNFPGAAPGDVLWRRNILKSLGLKLLFIDEEEWRRVNRSGKISYIKNLVGLSR